MTLNHFTSGIFDPVDVVGNESIAQPRNTQDTNTGAHTCFEGAGVEDVVGIDFTDNGGQSCNAEHDDQPTMDAAEAFKLIKQQVNVPLVADIHFDYRIALKVAEYGVDCLRINPGNIGNEERIRMVPLTMKQVLTAMIKAHEIQVEYPA